MSQSAYDGTYSENAAENYERFFVPAIGAPIAKDLIEAAALIPGEHVLDVGCGTGVVTRMAADKVGRGGSAAGLDVNPAMLAVARAATLETETVAITWYEASAEAIPLHDESFDVVLCQMSLQFVPSRLNALREMRRVLRVGGRLVLNVPGPTPALFEHFADALTKHVDPAAAPFVHAVFSLHDATEVRQLASDVGFKRVDVTQAMKALQLPSARNFMWEYIHSTPLAFAVAQATDEQRLALEREVCARWAEYSSGSGLAIDVGMTTLIATK